jgi:hypothetical protein
MTRFGKLTLTAALLVAVAGSAYGGNTTPTTHFVKPPGYDQDPWMHPYTREGAPKTN